MKQTSRMHARSSLSGAIAIALAAAALPVSVSQSRLARASARLDVYSTERARSPYGREVAAADPLPALLSGRQTWHIAPADLFRWADHTGSNHRVTMFPGAHFYLYDHFSSIAALLSADAPAPARVADLAEAS